MASFLQLFVIAATVATAYGDILNRTNSTYDYFVLSQRELLHEIDIVELQLTTVNDRFADRLEVIQFEQEQILLTVLQSSTNNSVEEDFENCNYKTARTAATLTIRANTTLDLARSYATSELSRILASCDYYSSHNETALEMCYARCVESATSVVINYLDRARDQLARSLYVAYAASKAAVRCTFEVERDTLVSVAQSTDKSIHDCEVSSNGCSNSWSLESN